MRKCFAALLCFVAVFALPFVLRLSADRLLEWQSSLSGRASLNLLKVLPYLCLGLSAVWAARIANTPVYVLSLILIPSQYYFSGARVGPVGGEQMRTALFLVLPVIVTLAQFVSHRTLACSIRNGLAVVLLGFVLPPVMSAALGRQILSWVGAHRWGGASFLGAPSSPTIFYLAVFLFNVFLPRAGREGQMKKLLAGIIPCFYFSGVFRPIFPSGPLYPPGLENIAFLLSTAMSSALMLYSNFFLSWSKAYVDDLTQVLGRRALNESLAHLQGRYAIAMVDIDHFKKFNDTYGHAAGDLVLREVAGILAEETGGRVYRYGGEEFSVLYSGIDAETAAADMDAVRQLLAETRISLNGASNGKRGGKVSVQISVGVSESGKKNSSAEDVIRAADRALYKAKENGRNRVERL